MTFGQIVEIASRLVERKQPAVSPKRRDQDVTRVLNHCFAKGDFQFVKPAEARQLLRQLN